MGNPTAATYTSLDIAYTYFNRWLFDNQLPPCLITMQRRNGSYGYFAGKRFANASSREELTDEIALNPAYFAYRKPIEIFSTLVHEMCHLWQYHFGTPASLSYHNKEWADKMVQVGLLPTATGAIGGKKTGQKMSHLIQEHGCFALVAAKLQAEYPAVLYHDHESDDQQTPTPEKKGTSKTKYACQQCGLKAWAKPNITLLCGTCFKPLCADKKEPDTLGHENLASPPEKQSAGARDTLERHPLHAHAWGSNESKGSDEHL